MEDEGLLAWMLINHLMTEHLTKQPDADYMALFGALQELAAEYLAAIDWRLLRVEGKELGGIEADWKASLAEWGVTYKGVVRLELTIMAAAREQEQSAAQQKLSA